MAAYGFEKMEYTRVESYMNSLKGIFDQYSELLESTNELITTSINNGDASALNSDLGGKFLSKWSESAEAFSNFKDYFDGLYNQVSEVTRYNQQFEEQGKDTVQSTTM